MATKISALKNINEDEIKSALIPTAVNGDNRKLKISEYFASLDSFNNLKVDFEKLVKEVEELGVAIGKIDTNLGDANDNLSNLEITLLTKIILPKPNKVVITTNSKTLTTSELDATKLNYLSDVTGNIQAQLNSKSNLGHTHLPSEINELEEKFNKISYAPNWYNIILYGNTANYTVNNQYTVSENCFFYHQIRYNHTKFYMYIDDILCGLFISVFGDGRVIFPVLIPLKKGQKIYFSGGDEWGNENINSTANNCYFKLIGIN